MSKKLVEISKTDRITARIKVLEGFFGKSGNTLGLDAGLGNATVDGWTDNQIDKSNAVVEKFLRHYGIREEWWKTGEGEIFITRAEKGSDNKGNPLGEQARTLKLLQDALSEGSDYRVIPKTILDGEYRIFPKSEMEQRARELEAQLKQQEDIRRERIETLDAKNKLIKKLEEEIAELRASKSVAPQSAQ